MALRLLRVTGFDPSPATPGNLRVLRVTGSGAAAVQGNLRVLRVSGTGAGQPTLATPKSVYEAGETVTITPINPAATHTYTWSTGTPSGSYVDGNGVLTFPAPTLLDPVQITVGYNGLAYITVTIHEASVTMGPTGIPCAIYINVP